MKTKTFKWLTGNLFLFTSIIAANQLDPSFGSSGTGIVTTSFGTRAVAQAIKIDGSNNSVITGYSTVNNQRQFLIARYTSMGILDTTFGTNGIVTTLIGDGAAQANSLAIQTDGKIVVGGYSISSGISVFTLARYNSDGSLDNAFGSSGIVTTTINESAGIRSIVLDASENIIATGVAVEDGSPNFALAKYDPSGVLDATFGTSGIVTESIGSSNAANFVTLDSSGKIVISGWTNIFALEETCFAILRFNTDGSLDTSFNGDGKLSFSVTGSSFTQANAHSTLADNSIIMVGTSTSDSTNVKRVEIAKITAEGALDATFGTSGVVITLIGSNASAYAVTIDSMSRIVATGATDNSIFVARYSSSGSIDTTFGTNGIEITEIGTESFAQSLALQTVGATENIVIAGSSDTNIALARYVPNASIFVTISNPINSSTVDSNIVRIKGTSSNAAASINIYIDDALFTTVMSDGSGNWDAGNSSLLTEGAHSIRADLLNGSSIIIAQDKIFFTIDDSAVPFNWPAGNVVRVDAIFGSDTEGERNGPPFATVTASLAAAQAGDVVWIFPGIYDESITIPSNVSVRGLSQSEVIIERLNVPSATDLVTMGENSVLETVSLQMTSAAHTAMRGIVFPGTTSATAQCRNISLVVDNSTAGDAGTSDVYGIHSTGTGTPDKVTLACQDSTITVQSAGQGAKRGILLDTANNFHVNNVYATVTRTGAGTGTYIGVQTNEAAAFFTAKSSFFSGTSADLAQTLGLITIDTTELANVNADGLGFTSLLSPTPFVFANTGVVIAGTTFMVPGTGTSTASELRIRVPHALIIKSISVTALTAPGTGVTDTWTVRRNGIDTTLATSLSEATTSSTNNAISVGFAEGDELSLKVDGGVGTATANVVVVLGVY